MFRWLRIKIWNALIKKIRNDPLAENGPEASPPSSGRKWPPVDNGGTSLDTPSPSPFDGTYPSEDPEEGP